MSRSEDERTRVVHYLANVRGVLDSVEIALQPNMGPPGMELPQTVVSSAHVLAAALTRMGAYQRAEEDLPTDRLRQVQDFIAALPRCAKCGHKSASPLGCLKSGCACKNAAHDPG